MSVINSDPTCVPVFAGLQMKAAFCPEAFLNRHMRDSYLYCWFPHFQSRSETFINYPPWMFVCEWHIKSSFKSIFLRIFTLRMWLVIEVFYRCKLWPETIYSDAVYIRVTSFPFLPFSALPTHYSRAFKQWRIAYNLYYFFRFGEGNLLFRPSKVGKFSPQLPAKKSWFHNFLRDF